MGDQLALFVHIFDRGADAKGYIGRIYSFQIQLYDCLVIERKIDLFVPGKHRDGFRLCIHGEHFTREVLDPDGLSWFGSLFTDGMGRSLRSFVGWGSAGCDQQSKADE